MKQIGWGIVGCGDVCERKSAPAMYKLPGSRLAAVMRRDEAKLRDFAARHGVAHAYTSADELIADPGVDIVYVATPPGSHMEYAIRAMEAGKPVYVEKPMAVTYADCLKMNAVARRTGQRLYVAYYRRSLPYFLKVKELLDGGAIGTVIGAEIRFSRPPLAEDLDPAHRPWRLDPRQAGEGYFFDMACHTLDVMDFLLGPVADAHGTAVNRAGLYEAPDTVCASMRFASGVAASGLWQYAANPVSACDRIRIAGTGGHVDFSTFSFEPVELVTPAGTARFNLPAPRHIQMPMIESIVTELQGHGRCPSTGETAARTSRVMDMIIAPVSGYPV